MKIGIDKIGFYTPPMFIDMEKLAEARDVDPAKYTIGIGQDRMAATPITQDAVTMATNAALDVLDAEDREAIDLVLIGTESGIDHSKSTAVYVHELTGIQGETRSVELKQACYGATAGIQMARGHIALHPDSKVLVIGSDIARYGLKMPGEPTQGAGAVAMVLSADPRILALEGDSVYQTKEIMDFWRPLYSDTAKVDGKYSNQMYIEFFLEAWDRYTEKTGRNITDFEAICFHLPYTKMGRKALNALQKEVGEKSLEKIYERYEHSIIYNREVGNIYTGSLYLSLLSLLENSRDLKDGDRIGLFSYGSGAVGEFFSATLQPGYKNSLLANKHRLLLDNRKELSVEEYEKVFLHQLPTDGSDIEVDTSYDFSPVVLAGRQNDSRKYIINNFE